MPKQTATKNPFTGRWRIVSMSACKDDYIDEEGYFGDQAFVEQN